MSWISTGDFARSPDCNPIENSMLKRCREVMEWDGDLSIIATLHSWWWLLKEKTWMTCSKQCNEWKHAWFPCYSCRSGHKSQKCEIFFTPFVIKCMISQKTMPSIGRHIPLIFLRRKFPVHYRFLSITIINSSQLFRFSLFADDTVIVSSHKNVHTFLCTSHSRM